VVAGRVLHIVRRREDTLAMSVIAAQSRDRSVEVVLVQDGVFVELPATLAVSVNGDDVAARGIDTPYRRVGYDDIAKMVCDAVCVTVW
jgi:sulfur transfer complex TusBCD TusB component (DsrH family)